MDINSFFFTILGEKLKSLIERSEVRVKESIQRERNRRECKSIKTYQDGYE